MARSKEATPFHQPAMVATLNDWGSVVAVAVAPADNECGKYVNPQIRIFSTGEEGESPHHIFISGRDAAEKLRDLCDKLLAAIPAGNEGNDM